MPKMSKNTKNFNKCLKNLLTISGVSREELACHLKVAVPVVNRWLNGASVPDVYQFRDIARFFGMPYEWFLDGEVHFPTAAELATVLGLSEDTVEELLSLARTENDAVLGAVDDAIYAVTSTVNAVYEVLLNAGNKAAEGVE